VPRLFGIIGLLVICAGLDLLWQSRHEIKFWMLAYLGFFRALLHNRESTPPVFPSKEAAQKRQGAALPARRQLRIPAGSPAHRHRRIAALLPTPLTVFGQRLRHPACPD